MLPQQIRYGNQVYVLAQQVKVGPRGGHIMGYTTAGRPIYAPSDKLVHRTGKLLRAQRASVATYDPDKVSRRQLRVGAGVRKHVRQSNLDATGRAEAATRHTRAAQLYRQYHHAAKHGTLDTERHRLDLSTAAAGLPVPADEREAAARAHVHHRLAESYTTFTRT